MPGLLSEADVERVFAEITAVMAQRPDVPEDLIQYDPCMRDKDHTQTNELHVRKLFRMAKHLTFFRELAQRPALLQTARDLLGPQVALVQTMLLMKPPEISGPKVWHQDNGYWKCVPANLVSCWLTLDDVDRTNGAMHVVPGSHRAPVNHDKSESTSALLDVGSQIDESKDEVIDLPSGGEMFHHCQTLH